MSLSVSAGTAALAASRIFAAASVVTKLHWWHVGHCVAPTGTAIARLWVLLNVPHIDAISLLDMSVRMKLRASGIVLTELARAAAGLPLPPLGTAGTCGVMKDETSLL